MAHLASTESGRLKQLRDIIAAVLEIEQEELTDTSNFVQDHDADSLMAIEIVARIEQEMGVAIPDEALPEMVNLNAALDLVDRYAA
jgi:acyl carrier protein